MNFLVFAAHSKGTGNSRSNPILQVYRHCQGLCSHYLSDAYSMCWTFLSLYVWANFAQCAYSGEMNIYAELVGQIHNSLQIPSTKAITRKEKSNPWYNEIC